MARFLNYTFPAASTTAVSQLQTLTEASPLLLNGALSNTIQTKIPFLDHGYSRQVSLTSANNLSGVNFTITGIQNGLTISEVVVGPNGGPVYGVEVYDEITSIVTDGAVDAVSAGTGYLGFMRFIPINIELLTIGVVINYVLEAGNPSADLPTTFYSAMKDLSTLNQSYSDLIAGDEGLSFLTEVKASGIAQLASYTSDLPVYGLLVEITGTPATLDATLEIIFRQV